MITITDAKRPILPTKNGDDAILETYLEHANITGHFEREARNVWALYKTLTNSKPLRDASRDDGRKLVAHFEAGGLKSATIQKKIGWLTAAVDLASEENKLKFNPVRASFRRDDKAKRFRQRSRHKGNQAQPSAARRRRSTMFRILASTGMRLSEAFEIDGEFKERGCRYVIVGKKTEQSERRVPLPANVLPFLPGIKGTLFRNNVPAASKRLNRFLNDCGIADPRKVVHSLRHRAQDRCVLAAPKMCDGRC